MHTHPEHPSQAADGRSEVSDNACLDSTEIRRERGAAVESKPTEPEEDGADDDVRRVVRLVREALGAPAAPAPEVD